MRLSIPESKHTGHCILGAISVAINYTHSLIISSNLLAYLAHNAERAESYAESYAEYAEDAENTAENAKYNDAAE